MRVYTLDNDKNLLAILKHANARTVRSIVGDLVKNKEESVALNILNGMSVKIGELNVDSIAVESTMFGCTNIVSLLMNKKSDSIKKNRLLTIACENNRLDIVKILIEYKADVNYHNGIPLINACIVGNLEMVKLLHEAGADISINDGLAFITAIEKGKFDLVKYFVENGIDVNIRYNTPLHTAKAKHFKEIADYLIENGATEHSNKMYAVPRTKSGIVSIVDTGSLTADILESEEK